MTAASLPSIGPPTPGAHTVPAPGGGVLTPVGRGLPRHGTRGSHALWLLPPARERSFREKAAAPSKANDCKTARL